MDEKIKDAFHQAYAGESKAALRLKMYAKKAQEEGLPQIAKLFQVISFSEEIQGARALRMLREIKNTEDNLKASFESTTKIAGVAYEQFVKEAADRGDTTASTIFSQCRDVEDIHSKLYKEAMSHLMEDRETIYYVCSACGYVSDGMLPDRCPVCQAPKEQFSKF